MALPFPRTNNLEWLRLIFALQVVISHTLTNVGGGSPRVLEHFPGVPAFFFVSGFLVYASYQNAGGRQYFANRALRLFPGLVFVTLGGLAVMVTGLGLDHLLANPGSYAAWFVSQVTLGQWYNPSFFRGVGLGVINGSLWTITTEMLFYLCVPVLAWLQARFKLAIVVAAAASFALYALGPKYLTAVVYRNKSIFDVLSLTPLVWGWMFAAGMLAVQHFAAIQRWLPRLIWSVLPLAAMMRWEDQQGALGVLFGSTGNQLGLIYFVCYAALVLWLSFATPHVPLKTDLSYGVYVWHAPITNLALIVGLPSFGFIVGLTLLMAAISWFGIEKPALKRKRQSLKAVG